MNKSNKRRKENPFDLAQTRGIKHHRKHGARVTGGQTRSSNRFVKKKPKAKFLQLENYDSWFSFASVQFISMLLVLNSCASFPMVETAVAKTNFFVTKRQQNKWIFFKKWAKQKMTTKNI